ncbi:MAG: carboxymethylenebutenolidase [Candidatus Peregrinibacteria bacterium Greene1014_49]|nr:MAG: carboxymethylenebutenolidase [Candidatus Peregrinibacteria bacterium Greene1014_49]
MKKLLLPLTALLLISCTPVAPGNQGMQDSSDDQNHSEGSSTAASLDRLNASPRHQEWVEVKNGDKTIYTWVVYPQTSEKRPVVIVIHENKGLNDWARSMADQVAEAGYIAVAPDLLSEFSAEVARTSDFPTPDDATKAIGQLTPDGVMSDLQAVSDWAKTIEASNGKLVSAGFCWGGAQSFAFAAKSDDLTAAMVFYGTGPTDASAYEKISSPVYGFYGGADARVNATIDQSAQNMTAANKTYDYKIYDGAGHAFMRSGEDPNGDPANVAARNAAWERMKQILSTL